MMYYLGNFHPKPLILPLHHLHHVIVVGKGGGIIIGAIGGFCIFLGLTGGLERGRGGG